MEVTFIQTCDPNKYLHLMSITSRTVRLFCDRYGFGYESYVGVKRGFWPWQASFNRIFILEEMINRGYAGWVFYLDADAYIVDLNFDLRAFLHSMQDKSFVATKSGASDRLWDINNGVFMVNLSKLAALKIVREWRWIFETADEDMLKRCTDFNMGIDDQSMLHQVLANTSNLSEILGQSPWDLINSSEATFVRQQLRVMNSTFEERVAAVRLAVDRVLEADRKLERQK